LYTGSTNNLTKRIKQHQNGRGARYTRGKQLELMYFETFLTRSDAMKREYEIKSLTQEEKWNLIETFQENLK
jgi:putative endonuclease